MTLLPILLLIFFSFFIGLLARERWRSWALLVASILAIFWMQPSTPIRHLDFWLPTAALALTIMAWAITLPKGIPNLRSNLPTALIIAGIILLIGLLRYLGPICCLTPTRPPALLQIVIVISLVVLTAFLFIRFLNGRVGWINAFIVLIIGLLIILKSEPLARMASLTLRSLNGQSIDLSSALDIKWLGFSYVAFRLIHTLRDRVSGRLPELTLQEYVIYTIFFPAYTAGPIDRVQRFTQDLRQPFRFSAETALNAGKRILMGIFKKFVLADSLALFALSSTNAMLVDSTAWLWVMLYGYALRIYFDFSGYTDIAIGVGLLFGFQLPENFDKPYLKQNLTLFWNSWHMTLAQWFRAYFFNPLTRSLRSNSRNIPLPLIILLGQISTFTLIGLWHGISWNFAIWGVWHGLGLFVHNRWSDMIRSKVSSLDGHPRLQRLVSYGGTLLTFQYVCLGWVWFALASPEQSWKVILKLFGIT